MKKKHFCILLSMLMAVTLLFGCGSDDSNSNANESVVETTKDSEETKASGSVEEKAPVTLTMWVWDDAQVPATQAMIDEFHDMYPYITVEITSIAGMADYNTKMRAVVGTADAPNVFWINFNLAKEYIPMGFVQGLNEFIDNDSGFNKDGLNASIIETYTVDGTLYGVPKDTDGFAVFYNKSLFDAAAVDYPEDGWTVDDFVETAKAMTSEGVVGWSNSTSDRVYYNFMYAYGGSPYTEDGLSPNVNSSESVEGMQVLLDMINDGSAYSRADLDEMGSGVAFESNLAAMTIDGSWMISEFYTALGDNLGIVKLPEGPNGIASTGHGIAYATTTTNPFMEETWLFLSYLGSDAAQEKQIEVVIPAANGCASIWESVYPDLNLAAFTTALDHNKSYLAVKNATAARSAFQEHLANMQSGMYDNAREAMDAAAQAMKDAIDE